MYMTRCILERFWEMMHHSRYCLAHRQYFLQYYQRLSLQYATYATHASTPTALPTLAHQPRHPLQHAIHTSTLPTPPTQARHSRQREQHAIFQTSPIFICLVYQINVLHIHGTLAQQYNMGRGSKKNYKYYFINFQSSMSLLDSHQLK